MITQIEWAYNNNKEKAKAYKSYNKEVRKKKRIQKKLNKKDKAQIIFSKNEMLLTKQGRSVIASPMEKIVKSILNKYNIKHYTEVSFKGLQTGKTNLSLLRFDFYVPSKNLLIEYDGKDYHCTPAQKKRDAMKNKYCKQHNINLQRFVAKDIPTLEEQICKLVL